MILDFILSSKYLDHTFLSIYVFFFLREVNLMKKKGRKHWWVIKEYCTIWLANYWFVIFFFMILAEFVSFPVMKISPLAIIFKMDELIRWGHCWDRDDELLLYKVFQVPTWNIFSLHCLYNFISFWEICSVLSNEKKKKLSPAVELLIAVLEMWLNSNVAWDVDSFYFKDAVQWLDWLFFLPRFCLCY